MKDYIATIQEILAGRNEDFDRAAAENKVKFVRHKDTRIEERTIDNKPDSYSLYDLYINHRQDFLDYQGEQAKPIFSNVDYIVTFLGEESTLSRLLGVYKVVGLSERKLPESPYCYDMIPAEGFDMLNEKIIIDWGTSAVSWHQYYNNIKKVIRIEGKLQTESGIPPFTSYSNVNVSYRQLKQIVEKNLIDYKNALKAVNCIYIITDKKNGKHYIGSTYNLAGGMWERWTGYAKTIHNGNIVLQEAIEADPNYENNFCWSILETLPLNIASHEAISRENLYKEKFMTREFGYNGN